MGKQDFEKFLLSQTAPVRPDFNSKEILSFWREQLNVLYQDIQSWLLEYGDKINFQFMETELTEELLGSYIVPSASIIVGNKQAQLIPVGTILIGTKGRVDLSGPAGTAKFILADRDVTRPKIILEEFISEADREEKRREKQEQSNLPTDWVWKATTSAPHIKYTTLTQDIFLDCLLGVLNA